MSPAEVAPAVETAPPADAPPAAATETVVYGGVARGFEPSLANPLTVFNLLQYTDRESLNVSYGLDLAVRTRFGFHIIQLDDVRTAKFATLAEVKPRIQQMLVQNKIDALIKGLRAKAKIE